MSTENKEERGDDAKEAAKHRQPLPGRGFHSAPSVHARNMGHSDRPSFITDQRRFNHHGGMEARPARVIRFVPKWQEAATRGDTYMAHAPLPRHP